MKNNILFAFLFLIQFASFSQDSDYSLCDCCTYSIFPLEDGNYSALNPQRIKANGITELTVYTTSKRKLKQIDSSLKVIDKEYREKIFRFNNEGYVLSQIFF